MNFPAVVMYNYEAVCHLFVLLCMEILVDLRVPVKCPMKRWKMGAETPRYMGKCLSHSNALEKLFCVFTV